MTRWGKVLLTTCVVAVCGCGIHVRKELGPEFRLQALPSVAVSDARQIKGISLRGLSPYSDSIETSPPVAAVVAGALSRGLGELREGDRLDASVVTAMCIVKNELVVGYGDFSLEVEATFQKGGNVFSRTLSASRVGEKEGAGFGGVDFETICTRHFKIALEALGRQARQAYTDGGS